VAARAADGIFMQELVPQLISAIFNRHYGKPILVIGGGPSVIEDLPQLPDPSYFSAIISANDHGFRQHKYPVTYGVSVDKTHIERKMPMRCFMQAFKIPLINRHSWADYRLVDWRLITNSGLTAVTVAAVLGGHPVVTTGIDMWVGGNLYFHRVRDKFRASPTRDGVRNKMRELGQWCGPAVLRSLRGPVAEHHGVFDPAEILPAVVAHSYRSAIGPPVYGKAKDDFLWAQGDHVPRGTPLVMSPAEYAKMRARHGIERWQPE
jgi:hypothetical protein